MDWLRGPIHHGRPASHQSPPNQNPRNPNLKNLENPEQPENPD